MRFERTPLLKYIQCKLLSYTVDFVKMKEMLKSKNFMQMYDDL